MSPALEKSGKRLFEKCTIATSFFTRFLGLMGRKSIAADEALIFPKCNSIHTFFMRFPIDIIFVSDKGNVIDIVESLPPWRMLSPRWAAKHVIETKAFRAQELGIAKGDSLHCSGVWGN